MTNKGEAVAKPQDRWRDLMAPLIFLAILNLVVLVLFRRIASSALADEPNYRATGQQPLAVILTMNRSWPIPYALWYWTLQQLGLTEVRATFATSAALALAVTALLYRYVHALSGSSNAALLAGAVYATSFVNLGLWPKVAAAALIPALISLTVGARSGWSPRSWVGFAWALLAVSYLRPEMVLAATLALVRAVLASWRGHNDRLRRALSVAALLALPVALYFTAGIPALGGHDRFSLALSQHFALNWVRWSGDERNPWLAHGDIWRAAFGPATGLTGALLANPGVFARHVADNLLGLFANSVTMIFISAAVVLPVGQLARSQVIGFLLFVVLISAVVWSARARPSHVRLRDTYFAWGIITAPCFVVSTLIYPRHHYVVWISVLGLAGLASVLGRCWRDRPSLAAFVGAFVLAMAIGPCLAARVGKKLQFRFGTVSTVTKTGSSVPLSAIAFACPVTPVALGTKETR